MSSSARAFGTLYSFAVVRKLGSAPATPRGYGVLRRHRLALADDGDLVEHVVREGDRAPERHFLGV
jgi:hypothetical protein